MNLPVAAQQRSDFVVFQSGRKIKASSILTIVALWAVIYLGSMFTPALLDDADTVHAEAAREMVLHQDWVTLHANGVRYLEKAPFMYWTVAASYSLFGVHDWSTRFPLMLGVLAMLLATYFLGREAYGESGGFWSAVVLATSLGPYLFTRFLIPDTLVGLWLALTFLFFLRSLREDPPSRLTCWGMAAACALNVLSKGLIGLVFPVGVIGLYLLLTGNLRQLLRLRLLSSTLVLLAIAAPWHVLASLRNPDQGSVRGFLWFYFVNEHFLRYLNKRVPRDYDTVPLLIFWGLLFLWLMPWVAFLPQSIKNVPRALERMANWIGSGEECKSSVSIVGGCDSVVLQFLHPPGVLHNSCDPRVGVAGGWLAGARTQIFPRQRRAQIRQNVVAGFVRGRTRRVRSGNAAFFCSENSRARR